MIFTPIIKVSNMINPPKPLSHKLSEVVKTAENASEAEKEKLRPILQSLIASPPVINVALAAMGSFAVSGFMHEYVITLVMKEPSRYEQFSFFILQGLLCIAQAAFQRLSGFGKSWGKGPLSNIFSWAIMGFLLLWTGSLFTAPYAREDVLTKDLFLPVPQPVFDTYNLLYNTIINNHTMFLISRQ